MAALRGDRKMPDHNADPLPASPEGTEPVLLVTTENTLGRSSRLVLLGAMTALGTTNVRLAVPDWDSIAAERLSQATGETAVLARMREKDLSRALGGRRDLDISRPPS